MKDQTRAASAQARLLYVADPMCSWCWGFAPVIAEIRAAFADRLPVDLVVGGLRPGTSQPMDAAARAEIRSHWQHVQDASGQPFDFDFFTREGSVYDTEPADRAVVVLRRAGPEVALAALTRIQKAFYAEGRDVTQPRFSARLPSSLASTSRTFGRPSTMTPPAKRR